MLSEQQKTATATTNPKKTKVALKEFSFPKGVLFLGLAVN